MKGLFDDVSFKCSKIVTQNYSTSFSMGIKLFDKSIRDSIFSIYGFVRFADEIVDTFHDYDKTTLFSNFEEDYYRAYDQGISLNPILNSFQITVRKYNIDDELIQAFLKSMRSDLSKKEFDDNEIKEYIYGSADVVGLMCLKVFVNGDEERYQALKPAAMRLGSAFQKVNFLRDINDDINQLHRIYFPILRDNELTENIKKKIIEYINEDFKVALEGIKELPDNSKNGVYAAYLYYTKLTTKIEYTPVEKLLNERIRIPNRSKIWTLASIYISNKLKLA
ncbi:phytoene/squalene synthase family protein [Aquimarina sp. MMG015]|uniref:phytoene/squalene synthase family protein n=1 Tax=Aquimarina TaxID=290174 RepID=UPI0003F789BC|nr:MULTISPECIES: phytoene/squalene synthase family protein [Aquimarina]AXT56270.1 phytoene/squalene synthase family protein [Aquimarina sp. AD1]MBQ4803627.1 phytoene/squalene synthase family protein [Aquimarina sp. MMG015]RKN17492.1 phytoene/squalene synthase family protein [Aquimarina sp. AD1]